MKVMPIIEKLKILMLCTALLLPTIMVAESRGCVSTDHVNIAGICYLLGNGEDGPELVIAFSYPATTTPSTSNVSNNPLLNQPMFVQPAPGVPKNPANIEKILINVNARLTIPKGESLAATTTSGIFDLVIPTIEKNTVVEKTVALGIPAGVYVSQDPFAANQNTLTPAGVEFFNTIKLYGGDLAVAVGTAARAKAVAAQLVKQGANSEQILVVPAVHMNDPNAVVVYVVRLPTMADLFTPAPQTQQ